MDIQKINTFLAKHGTHTLSVERVGSGGVTIGKAPAPSGVFPKWMTNCQDERNSDYFLQVPKTHITALYCCGEVCK